MARDLHTMADALRRAAAQHGARPAIHEPERLTTWAEADALADRVAAALAPRLARGDRVLLRAPRSVELAAALFGVWRAGGIAVPTESAWKPRQLRHVIDHCAPALALATERSRPELAELGLGDQRVLSLEGLPAGEAPRSVAAAVEPAILIYTSGSTGLPKGILQSHRTLIDGAASVTTYLRNTADDRLLAALPWSFDYGLSQLLSACWVGASVVIARSMLPKDLCDALVERHVTGFAGVPTLWGQLLSRFSPFERCDLSHLRYLTNSGGAIPPATLDRLRALLGDERIVLMYGLTEAFRSTYLPAEELARRPGSIGRAVPGVEVRVLREDGTEAAAGEVGELVHRGNHVFLGYWNDPEATAAVLRPDPLALPGSDAPPVVFSGDLVHRDEEGFLHFHGRRDHLLKSAGRCISPLEIEQTIHEAGGVGDVAVFGLPDELLGQRICAAVAPAGDADGLRDKLMAHCRRQLAPYMVPRDWWLLERLPHTPNGKIDLPALREWAATHEPSH